MNQASHANKNLKNCVLTSSYTNPSDPSSMRDHGTFRNAEYTVNYKPKISYQNGFTTDYERYLVPSGRPTNNSFYTFGGLSNINWAKVRESVISPKLLTNSELSNTSRG